MPNLYLSPASISHLAQFILAWVTAGYFALTARQRKSRSMSVFMAGFFVSIAVVIWLFFLDTALPPSSRLYAVYLENTTIGLFLTLLTQFACRFPQLYPQRKWEACLVLAVNLSYTLWEASFAVYRGSLLLKSGDVLYRPLNADYALVVNFLLVPLMFFRQIAVASQQERGAARHGFWHWSGLADLWRPRGQAARAVRAFMLIFLLPLGLSLLNLMRSLHSLPQVVFQSSMSAGILLTQFLFSLIYLNILSDITSFQVRLVGIVLVTVLAMFGTIGWVMTPLYAARYQPQLADQQTLRFTPNAGGGYDVEQIPLRFEADWGNKLALWPLRPDAPPAEYIADIAFPFPFYGQVAQTIWVISSGAVGIDMPLHYPSMEYNYATMPAIFSLFVSLVPTDDGGIFARVGAENLVITWSRMECAFDPQMVFTFQLTLYQDGAFEITIDGLPDLPYQFDAGPFNNVWVVGASPGIPGQLPQLVNFAHLPLQGGDHGVIQDHYIEFRCYLNQFLLPLAYLILGGSLLVVVGFPITFHLNLIRPLNRLLQGVKQVEAGDMETTIPVQYLDEIGFLTQAFNAMILQIRELVTDLETRVAERTRELTRQKQAAEAANRAKSTFLSNMSHELRTPLTAILGFTELMSQDRSLSVWQRENLETVHRSGEYLLSLINDVLDLSKIEAGKVELQPRVFDLHKMLLSLGEMFSLRAEQKGLTMQIDLAPDVPQYIHADLPKLRQVLINLLGNAVKFTEQGRIILRVSGRQGVGEEGIREEEDKEIVPVSLSTPSLSTLFFEIQDTGIGIAPDELSHIFEAFVQAENGRQMGPGTGLGLTISRQYVQLMGGDIAVRSQVGMGSIFSFNLPVEVMAHGQTEQPEQDVVGLEKGPCAPDGEPYRLLVADDSAVLRRLLTDMLRPLGFEMRQAANGKEAVELFQSWQPHLVWMDMRMPVMDGQEATRQIKALSQGRRTVVVALTASSFEQECAEILAGGCDDIVIKPFRKAQIWDVLHRHLDIWFAYTFPPCDLPGDAATQPAQPDRLESFSPQDLPVEWMISLQQAVAVGDVQQMLDVLADGKHLNISSALIDRLSELVHGFEHDKILRWLGQIGVRTD